VHRERFLPLGLLLLALLMVPAALARSPKDPLYRPNTADLRLARSVLLTTADLPSSFTDAGIDRSLDQSDGSTCQKTVRQPDLHRLVETADLDGHKFERKDEVTGYTAISSNASLFRSPAQAATAFAWLEQLAGRDLSSCFTAAIRSGLPSDAPNPLQARVTPVRRAGKGVKLVGWEIQTQLSSGGQEIPLDVAILYYKRGRAVTTLLEVNGGPGLPTSLLEQTSQAVTHKLLHARGLTTAGS
jgi:hypothetical protein